MKNYILLFAILVSVNLFAQSINPDTLSGRGEKKYSFFELETCVARYNGKIVGIGSSDPTSNPLVGIFYINANVFTKDDFFILVSKRKWEISNVNYLAKVVNLTKEKPYQMSDGLFTIGVEKIKIVSHIKIMD